MLLQTETVTSNDLIMLAIISFTLIVSALIVAIFILGRLYLQKRTEAHDLKNKLFEYQLKENSNGKK